LICSLLPKRHKIGGMFAGLYKSIVPIMRATAPGCPGEFAGTGIVATPTVVITCRHVVDELVEDDSIEGSLAAAYGVFCRSLLCRVTYARRSDSWDLCCLHFDSLPGMTPAPLVRSARLANHKLAAIGFTQENSICRQVVPELKVIQEELHEGRLQAAQFGSGLPSGFSGAPVLAEAEGLWHVVGMLCLGGETSATSKMIAVDPIASFLSREGIERSIADLPSAAPATHESAGKIHIGVGRDFKRNILRARGADIGMDVARDFRDSDVELNGESPEPD
jgi:hypothetical protein